MRLALICLIILSCSNCGLANVCASIHQQTAINIQESENITSCYKPKDKLGVRYTSGAVNNTGNTNVGSVSYAILLILAVTVYIFSGRSIVRRIFSILTK
jgi:hypothetical protein